MRRGKGTHRKRHSLIITGGNCRGPGKPLNFKKQLGAARDTTTADEGGDTKKNNPRLGMDRWGREKGGGPRCKKSSSKSFSMGRSNPSAKHEGGIGGWWGSLWFWKKIKMDLRRRRSSTQQRRKGMRPFEDYWKCLLTQKKKIGDHGLPRSKGETRRSTTSRKVPSGGPNLNAGVVTLTAAIKEARGDVLRD